MAGNLANKYFVSRDGVTWEDVTTKYDGVKVLAISGMNEKGEAVNVFTQQWVGSQEEDYQLVGDKVIRANVDLELTFICGTRYSLNANVDTQSVYDDFVSYVCDNGDFYIKTAYNGKYAHVVCLKGYKPTIQKLQRGALNSFIMGTIELHTLDMPQTSSPEPVLGNLYIGFGGATISDPTTLTNVQYRNTDNPAGSYTIVCPSLSYLWICFNGKIGDVTANGFEVPMNAPVSVGDYWCYRTANNIKPHTMTFNIEST